MVRVLRGSRQVQELHLGLQGAGNPGDQHRARNTAQRAAMRTHVKKYLKSIDGSDIEVAEKDYRIAVSQVDRAVRRGLHHRNTAARLKSRLNARLKSAVTPT